MLTAVTPPHQADIVDIVVTVPWPGGGSTSVVSAFTYSGGEVGAAPVCTYTISPQVANYPLTGGSGTVNVTTTAGCPWTAVSDATFVTITSGANGSGRGAVTYSVATSTVFFPSADAFRLRSSHDMSLAWMDLIIRSGRAFLYPVYKGTYERPTSDQEGSNADRDLRIAWSRDLGRAIDYLETRSDIDRTRLAFYGVSAGADAGVILTALEPRLKTSVLNGTGLWTTWAPEIDLLNYASRVRIPTLMLNGRYAFGEPLETAQRPLFALLGSPAEDKRHTVLEAGHVLPIDDVAREMLPWLDHYLGQVVHPSPTSTRIANSGR